LKVGIVGSRKRKDKESVYKLVDSLDEKDIVVSGGCRGVDTWAEERALQRGLRVKIYKPKLYMVQSRQDVIQRYYDRNKIVASESEVLYAFVSEDRKGGTENTIKWARLLGKRVVIK